jgi:hypothetical protein
MSSRNNDVAVVASVVRTNDNLISTADMLVHTRAARCRGSVTAAYAIARQSGKQIAYELVFRDELKRRLADKGKMSARAFVAASKSLVLTDLTRRLLCGHR